MMIMTRVFYPYSGQAQLAPSVEQSGDKNIGYISFVTLLTQFLFTDSPLIPPKTLGASGILFFGVDP